MFFNDCKTSEEIKAKYRQLAKQYHPDLGGDLETMKAVNIEYAFYVDRAIRQEKPGKSEAEYADLAEVNELIRQAIEKIVNLEGLQIEICGLWVWVDGNTKANKESLKAAGYQWAPKKLKWYFAGVRSRGRGGFEMDEIRDRYGSEMVKRPTAQASRPGLTGK